MSNALKCLLALLVIAPAIAWPDETTSSDLDELLKNVGPILDETGAYHNVAEPSDGAETLALNLDRCVELALAQNAQVLAAATEVTLREAQAGQARANRKPEVNAQVGYGYIDGLDQEIGRPAIRRLLGVEDYAPDKGTVTSGLSVSQVLYAGGQIQAGIKASKHLASSEAWREQAVRAEVAYQARSAYHDALLTHALVTVAAEALAVFKRHEQDTIIMEEEGVVTSFEVSRAQSEVGARKADLASAEAAARLADLNIRRILAIPDPRQINYDRDLPTAKVGSSIDELRTRTASQRPELRALGDALSAANAQITGAQGKFRPRAAASVSYVNVDGGGQVIPDGVQFNVGAEWDLYLGGQRKHELGEARARAEGLRIQLADMERLVILDLEQALIRLREARVGMATEKENVAVAEESTRLAKLRYQEGFGTQTEIIDSTLIHTQTKTALVQRIRDYYVAYADLERALGGNPAE
jgi:outer membrane protein